MRKKKTVKEELKRVPCIVLRDLTIMPNVIMHFDISEEISVNAMNYAMTSTQELLVTTPKEGDKETIENEDINRIGTMVSIRQVIKMPNKISRLMVEGKERAEIVAFSGTKKLRKVDVRTFSKDELNDVTPEQAEAMRREILQRFWEYISFFPRTGKTFRSQFLEIEDLGDMLDAIIANLPLENKKKQHILESLFVSQRYEEESRILEEELDVARIRSELAIKVNGKVEKDQKDYVLREQLRYIREELGDDSPETEADKYKKSLEKLDAPEEVKEHINKEIDRFMNIPSGSSESGVEQVYIETLLDMPWNKGSEENKSLDNAERILERDHYGLKKVKERMLEFLAVKNLTEKGQSPIILLVGPPGTGKTSIAKSIAEALNRKYIRISLGGVRDEAEIRGHRKTYVGAMPGVIAKGLQHAKVKNPLILLDEIDKISSEYHGATASALLEVLDSEQNRFFRDHYIEVPLDLSEVLFIATANTTDTIPVPLLDRMEVVEVSGYTENEKFHIAKEHLIGKQLKKNGLKRGNLRINDSAIRAMITSYTRESGVRSLERRIGEICRKTARKVYSEAEKKVSVSSRNLEEFLGNAKYLPEDEAKKPEIGIVRGLAWTSVGGVTLEIEVNEMPGKGALTLTGQLGDVMKESANIAFTLVRSMTEKYGKDAKYYKSHDFHLHIPEGAVPKDGPSAGITMTTALFSVATDSPVRGDIAMTGEIDLRGNVLPIGGLKEKLLAAKNAKMKTVLVPEKNKRDFSEISEEITEGLDIIYVKRIEEVLDLALVAMPEEKKAASAARTRRKK
ncbi:MAG: endopeptidase La [Lachnospiraceae bacterium]|nr:endopeptidase La [Lachnospiraceae bacterium]